jgi:hypothetical protein
MFISNWNIEDTERDRLNCYRLGLNNKGLKFKTDRYGHYPVGYREPLNVSEE